MFNSLWGSCFVRATSILQNREVASDAAQEALIRAAERIGAWDCGQGCFGSWLLKLVHNECINQLRKFRGRIDVPLEADELVAPVPEDPFWLQEIPDDLLAEFSEAFAKAFKRLVAEQRSLLLLHGVDGWPLPLIASLLGLNPRTEQIRYRNALEQLWRNLLEEAVRFPRVAAFLKSESPGVDRREPESNS